MKKIGIVDYGSGNFASVWNAVNSVSRDTLRITRKSEFDECSHIILPGVGAFRSAVERLGQMNITENLAEHVLKIGKPFLGICVGMQILADIGTEFGISKGLGYVTGSVEKLQTFSDDLTLPHIGWNSLDGMLNSPLFSNMDFDASFYFVHSFHMILNDVQANAVMCEYGDPFVAAISKNNIHGVQFHPEKSQYYGLKVIENFLQFH